MNGAALSVLVLHEQVGADGRADELDTLLQAGQVAAALREAGHCVAVSQAGLDMDATLAAIERSRPDCIFNLVESLGGDGRLIHLVPALLGTAGIPFTGSTGDAIYLSSQKQLAKRWMRMHGIPTPASATAHDAGALNGCRWIVKSLWEHASFGMDDGCVVEGGDAALARIDACGRRYGGDWFAEQYIEGREFNISVLETADGPRVLPLAEIGFDAFPPGKPRIVGYAAKWDPEAPEYGATPRIFPDLPDSLGKSLERLALQCWDSFGLSGYARVDVRLDERGDPWVLEINANPCLSGDAGFAAAAARAGVAYDQLIQTVVDAALHNGTAGKDRCVDDIDTEVYR